MNSPKLALVPDNLGPFIYLRLPMLFKRVLALMSHHWSQVSTAHVGTQMVVVVDTFFNRLLRLFKSNEHSVQPEIRL